MGTAEQDAEEWGGMVERVKNLEGWQKQQNGSIHRVEDKVEKLQYWAFAQVIGILLAIIAVLSRHPL